jgi:hypothetical protein
MGKKQLGLYAQDSWKVTRKLTVDYGLRYDFSTYLKEQYGRAPEFSATTPNPSAGNLLGATIYEGTGPGHCNCNIAHNYPFAFGPRLGVAYQINSKTVFRAGFGIVYGGTAVNNNAAGGLAGSSANNAQPTFGSPAAILAQGYPATGYPPAWPNFSAGQFPTQAPTPGVGPVLMDPNAGRPARQYQWSIGVQREISKDFVAEVSYVANRGVWWQAPVLLNLNAITPSRLQAFHLDPTNADDQKLLTSLLSSSLAAQRGFNIPPYAGFPLGQTVAQALRPFPQFTNIGIYWDPLGKSWYDSLQVKATKRLSHGLSFLGTFVWSKAESLGTEIGEPNPGTTGGALGNDIFNRAANKYISIYDQPFVFNLSASYVTPKVGGNKYLSLALRDWTYSAALQYASGFPLQTPLANSNLNSYLFQGSSFANRVPGQSLFNTNWVDNKGVTHTDPIDVNCHCYDPNKTFVLNSNAWADPAAGQFGASAAYYGDYRTQRRPHENMNLGRTFKVKERMEFNIRIEFTNVFNRAYWGDPSGTALTNATLKQALITTPGPTFGNTSAGFGRVLTTGATQFGNAANILPRQGVVVGRFSF